jgi:type IV pilus assembly protein PilA
MLRSRLRADDGFSLVEILVVILIIGILAAIALPAFLNQRSKGQDAHAKSAANTAAKAMRVYENEHGGSFAGAQPSDLIEIERALGQARNLSVVSTGNTFTVSVDSVAGGSFSIQRRASGNSFRTCSQPGVGTCSAIADAQGNRW